MTRSVITRSLKERLARLEGATRAAPPPAAPSGVAEATASYPSGGPRCDPADLTTVPIFVEALGGGEFVRTPFGQVFRLTHRTLLGSPHGRFTPGECLDAARLAPDATDALTGLCGAGLHPADLLFLDVETTGLSGGAGVLAFLVGIGFFDLLQGAFVVEQFLLREPDDEPALLALLAERAHGRRALCTFNGRSFDRPLLQTRHLLNRAPLSGALGEEAPHLDLLVAARRLYRKRVGSCRLGALEGALLDVRRYEDVAGAEMPSRYRRFLMAGEARLLRPVIEHNRIDVLSMVTLLTLQIRSYAMLDREIHYEDLLGVAKQALSSNAPGRAASALEHAVKLRPDEPQPHLTLATVYERHLDDAERALAANLRVLELFRLGGAAGGTTTVTEVQAQRTARRAARLKRRLACPYLPHIF